MEAQNKVQNYSFEINDYKNKYQNNTSPSPLSSKPKNNIFQENNKENIDSNRQYLISDNSQSAINPLSKSHDNLNTSNNMNQANIFTAVEYNDIERVNELLTQDNSQINELNEEGLSLLHIAVIKANIKMINLLLSFGADSNVLSDKKKQTPLHLAYLNQNSLTEEIIKELMKYKADDNIYDSKNKKPSDYMSSSSKKNRNKKFNICLNNDNSNIECINKDKNYINNNTGNTITVVTIDNHLDSFLTTNKEDEVKSNHNNINNNSNNNTINNNILSPSKLEVDYDLNEIISINNSVEKSNNQINHKEELNINNEIDESRRQYSFGGEDDCLKIQNKKSDLCIDINNINNKKQNNSLDNIDINNKYFINNNKNDNKSEEEEHKNDSNENQEDIDINKTPKENEILNDSLEEENDIKEKESDINNENDKMEDGDEKEEKEEKNEEIYDSLKNSKTSNKDNILNSFNLNNNSLTYTESININGSNYNSKNKISNNKIGSNNNINENEENENNVAEEIILKPPNSDKNLNVNSQDKKEINENVDDEFLTKIITHKRDSFKKASHKKDNLSRASLYSINNTNENFRLSEFKNNILNLGENDIFNYSLKSNKSNRTNYLSPSNIHKKILGENKNSIKYLYKQKKRDSHNNPKSQNNSYKNNNTVIHNIHSGTDSRVGFSRDATQYSTQSQNNKMKNILNSKDKIKVITNDNSSLNFFNNNKVTEFNCNEIIDNNINLTYLKYWLNNLGLIEFYSNFTNNNITDIKILIEKMKSYQTKPRYETLESRLKIRIPGYIYRILCKLEADAGLIDPKIVKFMIREGINNDSKNNMIKSINKDNNLNISMTQSCYQCFNCCKLNQIKKEKKNNLKYFLLRYNLVHLYQNFYHNGFDMIEYVILQMYSSVPINDDILENYFHIYNEKQRAITLKAIVAEMKIINRFMNSDEYNNCDKSLIKYDNVFFEENDNKDKAKIYMKNNNKNESECIVY